MVEEKSWQEFMDTGLLWWINRSLHLFGWAIAVNVDKENNVIKVCPVRCTWRGFDTETEGKSFIKLTDYLDKNSSTLLKEAQEDPEE